MKAERRCADRPHSLSKERVFVLKRVDAEGTTFWSESRLLEKGYLKGLG